MRKWMFASFSTGAFAVRALPRTTECLGRESGDEPRTNSVMKRHIVPYLGMFEWGECSKLPRREAPQTVGRRPVVRGLPLLFLCANRESYTSDNHPAH